MVRKQVKTLRGGALNQSRANPGMELLESRELLSTALLGLDPQAPLIGYFEGQMNYAADTHVLHLQGMPSTIQQTPGGPVNVVISTIPDLKLDIQVDSAGNLIGGVAGDDLSISGGADLNGDYVPDVSGVLLTGEVREFGSLDTGTNVDKYDFRFVVTGGLLANLWAGQDIGVTTTSENSDFSGSFQTNFTGLAKGNVGAVQPLIVGTPNIQIFKNGPVIAHAGQPITYNYIVVNPGDVPLSNVSVVDDKAGTATFGGGDTNNNNKLDPGEVWTYSATTTPAFSLAGTLVNVATATGTSGNDTVSNQASYTLNPYLVDKALYLYYGSTTCKTYAVPYTGPDTATFTVQAYKGADLVDTFSVSAGSPQGLWLSDGAYSFQEVNVPAGYVNVSSAVA
ncbi:MAG: hypothetical protein NT031_03600, partial [Planctomycetota bacterium]|nr:hypothetical protein [Planctomycetota bacterium]